jgi:DNA-binding beta-propeller fold protein YncE
MKRKQCARISTRLAAIFSASCLTALSFANSPLMPSDLLIANLTSPEGVYQIRSNSLVQTLTTGTGYGTIRGASPTPSGKIVSTWATPPNQSTNALVVFDPSTGGIVTINTPQVVLPCDVSVTASGDYVVNDQWGSDVDVYSSSGAFLRTLTLPPLSGERSPMGNAVAPDGTIWVTMARRQDILHYSATGTFLGSFLPGFNPGDIAVDPADGTLWFPDINSNRVYHYTAAGSPLSSFATAIPAASQSFMGIAITGNRNLYVSSSASSNVYLYKQDGAALGAFSLPNSSAYITFMNAVVPEPSTTALALIGASVVVIGQGKRLSRSVTSQAR